MVRDKCQLNAEIVKVLSELREKIVLVSSEKAVLTIIDDFISRYRIISDLIVSEEFKDQFLDAVVEDIKQEDFLEFMITDDCKLCGSQRCYCDPAEYREYAKSCGAFKNFLRKKKEVCK